MFGIALVDFVKLHYSPSLELRYPLNYEIWDVFDRLTEIYHLLKNKVELQRDYRLLDFCKWLETILSLHLL